MSLDKNVEYEVGITEEEHLIDESTGKLTQRGIDYIEKDLDFGRMVRECPPMAIETYNRMHDAARGYIDKKYFIEMTGFRQNKATKQLFER